MSDKLNSNYLADCYDAVLDYSEQRHWLGYNKHDGLNSPFLNALLGWGKWPRIIAIQIVTRAPVNLRPLLAVKHSLNPKGLALFARAELNRFEATHKQAHLYRAEYLLQLLNDNTSPGEWSGTAWGYHYPWCDPGFYAPRNTPNAVVTSFVCEAFLHAYRITKKQDYLQTVENAIPFFLNDLPILKQTDDELCLGYMPMPMTMRVMDVSILVAAVLAQWGELAQSTTHANTAEKLIRYVVNQQTDEGAWFYTDPPNDSRITHDNYHTGFILDAINRYHRAINVPVFQNAYDSGLKFYAKNLFMPDGAPKWMHDKPFPHDIHGAAQGIITFSRHRAEYPGLADRIQRWAMLNMYNPEGRFYYQRSAHRTKRFTLLRWCNAWMAYALSCYLKPQGTQNNGTD